MLNPFRNISHWSWFPIHKGWSEFRICTLSTWLCTFFLKVRLQMIQKHNFRILKVQMHIYIYHFCKYISMYVSKYRHQFFIIKSNFWYLHKANWFKESLITFKGQLISKCPFGVFKSPKKTNEIFSRISALASKKRSNQKSSVRESK